MKFLDIDLAVILLTALYIITQVASACQGITTSSDS